MLDLAQNSPPKVKNTNTYHYSGQKIGPLPIKIHPHSILQVPTTQLAKMSIDLKFVELTADVLEIFFIKYSKLQLALLGDPKQTLRVRATRCCSNGDLRSQHLSAFP